MHVPWCFSLRCWAQSKAARAPSLPAPGSCPLTAPLSSLIPLPGCRRSAVFLLAVCAGPGWDPASSPSLPEAGSTRLFNAGLDENMSCLGSTRGGIGKAIKPMVAPSLHSPRPSFLRMLLPVCTSPQRGSIAPTGHRAHQVSPGSDEDLGAEAKGSAQRPFGSGAVPCSSSPAQGRSKDPRTRPCTGASLAAGAS